MTVHGTAQACHLSCTQTANATEITQPAAVTFHLSIQCDTVGQADSMSALASSFEAPTGTLLPENYLAQLFPIGLSPAGVPVVYGSPVVREYSVGLDYASCAAQPGAQIATDGTVTLDNVVTGQAWWFQNVFTCETPIVCRPPTTGTGATRTIGFWKTHVQALGTCIAGGVDIGFGALTLPQALGILWADPASYSGLQRSTLLLGRQLIAATCNVTQFGASPAEFKVADGVALIAARDCSGMMGLYPLVDAFNNLNDNVALPFDPGPAIGVKARDLAGDPGLPAGTCAQ